MAKLYHSENITLMCRITGTISTQDFLNEQDLKIADAMNQYMAHGGPDDYGLYQNQKVVLGNRRLALVDLSQNGHQPMEYMGETVITFNGEIYNYLEIKEELVSKNYQFSTASDTEVILAAYNCWGKDAFKKLRGMYAFCLLDLVSNCVYLVRDPMGIKPLYYTHSGTKITFASEVKAIQSVCKTEEDETWKVLFLAFGHIPEPFTTLKYVKSLPKGHYLKTDLKNGKTDLVKFFAFDYEERIDDADIAIHNIKAALTKAVERHLIADAPIGVFLSGGIDSSVLALISDKLSKQLNTISMTFDENTFSEESYQKIVLEKINSNHTLYKLTRKEFETNFLDAVNAMDQPSIDGLNTWFICKKAKEKGLKAVLSGVGADELLGGYPSFDRGLAIKILGVLPSSLLKWLSVFPSKILQRLSYLSFKNALGEYLFLRGLYDPKSISLILNIPLKEVERIIKQIELKIPKVIEEKQTAKISWLETNIYLQNQLLKDSDFMSMRQSVEIRTPFLDEDFVQTCLHIKSSLKFDRKQKKQLLINAFKDILPEEIYNRPKMGFLLPFSQWLKSNHHFHSVLTQSSDYGKKTDAEDFKKNKISWAKALALFQLKLNKFT